MDFSKLLNQNLNSMLGGAEGGGAMVWVVALVVVLAAVGVYMYLNEYFSCSAGRVSVDGKCVNICPEKYTFKSMDANNSKNGVCTKDGETPAVDYSVPLPTPTPSATPVPTSSTK